MRTAALAAVLTALAALAAPALAQAPGAGRGIDVVPDPASTRVSESRTLAELGDVVPGTVVRDAVLVRSNLTTPQEVHLYAADAVPALGGGFGFDARGEPGEQVGGWLRPSLARVTVPPGGAVPVPYELTVPAGTPAGEYVGAVVAEPVVAQTGVGVQTATRFAMAVYLRVPGAAPGTTPGRGRPGGGLVVTALEPGHAGGRSCPVVRVRNESQDIVDPSAVVVTDGVLSPRRTYEQDRLGALLPDTAATLRLRCVDRPIGPGRVTVTVGDAAASEPLEGVYLPWPFVLAVLALVLLLLALLWLLLRGRRRRADESPAAERPGT